MSTFFMNRSSILYNNNIIIKNNNYAIIRVSYLLEHERYDGVIKVSDNEAIAKT